MKLLVAPNGIGGGQRISWYRKLLDFEWTSDYNDPDISSAIYYDKRNKLQYPHELFKPIEERGIHVWNKHLKSIKKDYVDDVFTSAFGYSLRVDPTTHRGMCGVKTSQNAIHNIKFVECPIKPWQVDRRARMSALGEPHYR